MFNKFVNFIFKMIGYTFKIFALAFPIIFLLLTDYTKYGVNILTLTPLVLYLLILFC